MEVVYVEPMVLQASSEPGIKAGMMAVVPHITDEMNDHWDEYTTVEQPDPENWPENAPLPYGAVVCAGQSLSRADYPRLSAVFHGTGGFYEFELPNLVKKFILGVDEDGEFILGDGIVYYLDIPSTERPSRNVLDA